MICPKCGSHNVSVLKVTEHKKRGCLAVLGWLFLACFTCGLVLLFPLLSSKGSKTKKYAVCQDCGRRWRV